MKNLFLFATIICTIMFYTSCTSVKTIVLNVEKPAQVMLPPTIENIAVVNNALPQPANKGHINYKYTKKGEKIEENVDVKSDSVCYLFTETMFNELSNLDTFKNISFYEYPLRNDLDYTESPLIDSLQLKDLFDILQTDAIISLDGFMVNTTYHEELQDFGFNAKFLDAKIDATFRVYFKYDNKVSTPFYLSDSIYWDAVYSSNNQQLLTEDSIPSRENALKQAATYMGEKVAKAFGSTWTDKVRIYYGDIKEANKMVDANNWEKASSIWLEAFNTEDKVKKKARLANNIALSYEVTDNIREALRWAEKSKDLFDESKESSIDNYNYLSAKLYYDELMERYKDFRLLDSRKK